MKTPTGILRPLRDRIGNASGRAIWSSGRSIAMTDVVRGTALGGRRPEFAGRSVLILTSDPLAAALALIELDGVARRLVICPPELPQEHLPGVIEKAGVDGIVCDGNSEQRDFGIRLRAACDFTIRPLGEGGGLEPIPSEWVLLTSGTTGEPKLIVHTLDTLSAPVLSDENPGPAGGAAPAVWGTFYDIRRYGGMQVLLRAILGPGSLVLGSPSESVGEYLLRLAAHGATHISGTPSHWRRALMSPEIRKIAPRYVRLSGEIVDQPVLNALRSSFPEARIGHAFASTEAGVAFDVNDGLEGFPVCVAGGCGEVELNTERGSLRIRSNRMALGRLGDGERRLTDEEGFIDTGDMVELRAGRYYFVGRRNGIINVGGLKVHPEEVEAVINRHPAVLMSRVQARRNSIAGALVAAEVILKERPGEIENQDRAGEYEREILRLCRENLPAHKIPATIRRVTEFPLTAAGKVSRQPA
jgi:acyl-coenzyme A synthetase/AMP-(fatty) acid ligase